GIRAGLVYNSKIARLSRRHNNTNVLVLPAGFLKKEEAKKIVKVWLTTKFEGGRHLRRVKKIKDIEGKENV
ncbi:MAG TPA: RpiB/LacA/LacB family sugar-phosphate isomerase, partial [Candidatus Aerophobetes bacterium]|nr:RpiB/LacA/LacB family sugar-phosphate isomerase [Candidatus Aerophobetes bacterium]